MNRTDCGFHAARPFFVRLLTGVRRPRMTVLGTEFAGVVEAVGGRVTSFAAGDRVVDYTAQDFTMDSQRYDVVLDAVGKSSFGRCRRLLKPRGVYLSSEFGPLSQNLLLALVTPLGRGRKVRLNISRDDPRMAGELRELIESGVFRPLVDRRYPLDEIVEAYRYVETGQKIGNVVISVRPPDR